MHGERNSKFFHHRAWLDGKKQLILKLKDECGVWLDNKHDIAAKFISDYKARFTTMSRGQNPNLDLNLPQVITDSDNLELVKLPNMDEVKQALFAIDSNKTPGPDGFGAGFFKHYWAVVKDDFFQCILEFFTHGKLLKQINHTFIALIPKVDNPLQTQ